MNEFIKFAWFLLLFLFFLPWYFIFVPVVIIAAFVFYNDITYDPIKETIKKYEEEIYFEPDPEEKEKLRELMETEIGYMKKIDEENKAYEEKERIKREYVKQRKKERRIERWRKLTSWFRTK